MNRGEIKKLLGIHGLAPSRKRGQNFLADPLMAESIVQAAGVTPGETVVELGVGLGALTIPLARVAARVIGIELDSGIIDYHRRQKDLPENVELRHQDMLKADFTEIATNTGSPLKVIANLPYSVSSPLLFKLLESRDSISYAALMLQKELADRLTAAPGSKDYSILTVLFAASAKVDKVLAVGPESFHPRPRVDSAVVRIEFMGREERESRFPPHDLKKLRRTVKVSFSQRRKTLLNCLKSGGLIEGREEGEKILTRLGIDPATRSERLRVEEFIALSRSLFPNRPPE